MALKLFTDLIDALGKVAGGIKAILATEGEVALFIGQQFQQLANDARSADQDAQRTESVQDEIAAFRASLVAEWQELVKQEPTFYKIV